MRRKKGERHTLKWIVTAACLCLVFACIITVAYFTYKSHPVQQWTATFAPEDYFKYNGSGDDGADGQQIADEEIPYVYTRDFSDSRKSMEDDGIIPIVEKHPLFTCEGNYNKDKSLYSVHFLWSNRDDMEESYSDLEITAAPEEIPELLTGAMYGANSSAYVEEPAVTVTERDGIAIVAKGGEGADKTLTFQNDTGWYQVKGGWGNDFEDIAEMLDWLWEHPIDFSLFPMEKGDNYTYSYFDEYTKKSPDIPKEFLSYIPDFKFLGYQEESIRYTHKNGKPYDFDGTYEAKGKPQITWCIFTQPDYYDQKKILGSLEDMDIGKLSQVMKSDEPLLFSWDHYYIRIFISSDGTPEDVQRILESIRRKSGSR